MIFIFTWNAWEEFSWWLENDPDIAVRIKDLLDDMKKDPFHGIGKPEPLKYDLKGYWSRRISAEHRLVYKIEGSKGKSRQCSILQCQFHYDP